LRITADFFGKKLWIPKIEEASALGGIIAGLRALGVIDKGEKMLIRTSFFVCGA